MTLRIRSVCFSGFLAILGGCTSSTTEEDSNTTATADAVTAAAGSVCLQGRLTTAGIVRLRNATDLIAFAGDANCASTQVALDANIDLAAIPGFKGIPKLTGTFDGLGHEIANATLPCSGVFGLIDRGVVKNLRLRNVNVAGPTDACGVLAGEIKSATLDAIDASGTVRSTGDAVGGLVGKAWFSRLRKLHFSGTVAGKDSVGGLVGHSIDSEFSGSSAAGSAKGNADVGGFVGFWTGIVGPGFIVNSFAETDVTCTSRCGGLVGNAPSIGSISDSYARGRVAGGSIVGGLIGLAGSPSVFDLKIARTYATGPVSGQSAGGLIGRRASAQVPAPVSSYWDVASSGVRTSAGGTGRTTTQMHAKTTYSGWDFTRVWTIAAGQYPTLR